MDARSNKDRRQNDRRQKDVPVEVNHRSTERRVKVNRRRQIDPTTCERDYSPEEVEFMSALDDYKRRSGRMFPTCSEILEVIRALGYEKRAEMPTVAQPGRAGCDLHGGQRAGGLNGRKPLNCWTGAGRPSAAREEIARTP